MRAGLLTVLLLHIAFCMYAQNEQKMFWALNQSGLLVWDGTPANGLVNNGSGTWDLTTPRWTRSNGAANINYNQGSRPYFGGNPGTGAAGTVTVGTPVTADAMFFRPAASGNFTISGSTITGVGSTFPIDVATGLSPTISSNIMGSSGLTKTGAGTLIVNGTNEYSGSTNIEAGTLNCSDPNSWGSLPSGPVNVNGGILDIDTYYPYIGTCGNWWLNGVNITPYCTGGTLVLSSNTTNQTGSAFYKSKIRTDGDFTASFTYYVQGNMDGDGMAFIIQNSSQYALGSSAGSCGSCLGYQGVGNSVGVLFNFYPGNPVGIQYATNGSFSYSGYSSVSPVRFTAGYAVNVIITYDNTAKTLNVDLTEQTTARTYNTTYTNVDIPAVVGSPVAWIGFSAASGAAYATQKIGNFNFADRKWNIAVDATTTPSSTSSGKIVLAAAPNLGGKTVNIVLNGSTTGFTWNAVTWTGTATGTPILQLNGSNVTSGVSYGGTTVSYSTTLGIRVTR